MKIKSGTYRLLYKNLVFAFWNKDLQETKWKRKQPNLDEPRIWMVQSHSKIPGGEPIYIVQEKVMKNANFKPKYYYNRYRAAQKDVSEISIDEQALIDAFIYLGDKQQRAITPDSFGRKIAEAMLKEFETREPIEVALLADIENNPSIPPEFRLIVKYLIEGKWWFCFRGHPIHPERHSKKWILVHNKMVFSLDKGGGVKVEKLKRSFHEKYSNCYGYVDFKMSNLNTLAINVSPEDNLNEHCHIKINITLFDKKQLFLGQFLQHEPKGGISSGSAILISSEIQSGTRGRQVAYEAGHYNLEGGLFNDPPSKKLPFPFKEIAFYFAERELNSMRTTHEDILTIKDLKNWKSRRPLVSKNTVKPR